MLWKEKEGVKKYQLVRWSEVCQPKELGGGGGREGVGVKISELKNINLLYKWSWQSKNEEGI